MPQDQYQYVKLPDGSYGKFLASASDAQIRGAISKDFPSAFPKTKIPDKTTIGPSTGRVARTPTDQLSAWGTIKRYSGLEGIGAGMDAALQSTVPIEGYTPQGRAEHPVLSRVGDVTKGLKELFFGGQAAGMPMGTKEGLVNNPISAALSMADAAPEIGASVEEFLSSGEPLAKINKLLGVGAKEVRVGQTPASLEEFSANPARGVVKYGMDEKVLSKMDPLERTKAITDARNAAGAKLDQVLNANANKAINVQKVVDDTFKQIPDPKMVKLATTRVQQILQKAGINKPLSQLTPMEARTIQRGLDDFANFAPDGAVKSFNDVATALRRGISKATRQAIPETAELDQDYGDLAGAVKASVRQANKYARTVPENKLRRMIVKGAIGGAAAGAGYAMGKKVHLPMVP